MGIFGSTVRTLLGMLPVAVIDRIRRSPGSPEPDERKLRRLGPTLWDCIQNMKRNGFTPGSIVDVGALAGDWTREVHSVFPAVPILMIEGAAERDPTLAAVKRELDCFVDYEIARLAGSSGCRLFHLVDVRSGASSGPFGPRGTAARPQVRSALSTITLDDLLAPRVLPPPHFLKLDVQGCDLTILRGAERTLARTEAVVIEVSLTESNESAPLAAEVIAAMRQHGLALHDISSQARRPADQVLYRADFIFVRQDSGLRAPTEKLEP